MAVLRLLSVQCKNQQEAGSDEIYFTFKDNGSLAEGRTNVITSMDEENGGDLFKMTDRFSFSGSVDVRLYEEDTANPDDFIDSTTFTFSKSQNGIDKTEVFEATGVKYILTYDIIA